MKTRYFVVALTAATLMAVSLAAHHFSRSDSVTVDRHAHAVNLDSESHRYPVPTGTEHRLAEYYTSGAIQYIIDWTLQTTGDTPPVGDHEFLVTLYNSLNRSVSVSAEDAKAFTIGCASYSDDRATTRGEPVGHSFGPYEIKKVKVTVKSTCTYLGTADGGSYWPIY